MRATIAQSHTFSARFAAVALALGLMVASVTGCTADKLPEGTASIEGTVTQATLSAGGLGTVLVEGPEQPPGAVSDKASVTLTEETLFFDANGKRLSERPALEVGTEVRMWFTGPVAESYPVQATAGTVQLR